MTPSKMKAKELVDKFMDYVVPTFQEFAKECALICVDEIIATNMLIDEDVYVETKSYLGFWQEVKKEINLL